MPVAAGASNLFFSRDTKVFLQKNGTIWEVPVLNGYNFSQSTNTSDVTLSEMSDATGASRRGSKVFTDSFSPAEWSFDTYARPFIIPADGADPAQTRVVEEVLWANFVADNTYDPATKLWAQGVTVAPTKIDFDFEDSNKILLGTFDLFFVLGASSVTGMNYTADGDTTIYKIKNAVANEVGISFDIDGIATLAWSGFGGQLEEQASFDASSAITTGINRTDNFIRNRLTQLSAVSSVSGSSKTYSITLTGGSITINNGITFLTPETLGRVNHPLGHVTGTRQVSGSFTAYMDEKTNGTIELFEDLSLATTAITNKFALDFYVGGKASSGDVPVGPGIQFKLPQAHLSLPGFDMGDVIAVNVDFRGLPSSISGTDEISKITYVGV